MGICRYTPAKFNMEAENEPLEEEIPSGNYQFQVSGSMFSLRGCREDVIVFRTFLGE